MVSRAVIKRIRKFSNNMRRNLLDTALSAGMSSSHIGGGLSIIDITAALYCEVM